jgi:hypothetical protein
MRIDDARNAPHLVKDLPLMIGRSAALERVPVDGCAVGDSRPERD